MINYNEWVALMKDLVKAFNGFRVYILEQCEQIIRGKVKDLIPINDADGKSSPSLNNSRRPICPPYRSNSTKTLKHPEI